jgi:hypothetical protein
MAHLRLVRSYSLINLEKIVPADEEIWHGARVCGVFQPGAGAEIALHERPTEKRSRCHETLPDCGLVRRTGCYGAS